MICFKSCSQLLTLAMDCATKMMASRQPIFCLIMTPTSPHTMPMRLDISTGRSSALISVCLNGFTRLGIRGSPLTTAELRDTGPFFFILTGCRLSAYRSQCKNLHQQQQVERFSYWLLCFLFKNQTTFTYAQTKPDSELSSFSSKAVADKRAGVLEINFGNPP